MIFGLYGPITMKQKPSEKHWPPSKSNNYDQIIPLMRKWWVWNNEPHQSQQMINNIEDLQDYNNFLKIREYAKLHVHLMQCKHYGAEWQEELDEYNEWLGQHLGWLILKHDINRAFAEKQYRAEYYEED